jgi:hypothetical protein
MKADTESKVWLEIMRLALHYPSPHNCQPIKLEVTSPDTAKVFFDTDRGLFASEFGYSFSYLSVGVFIEFVVQSAGALGYKLEYTPQLAEIDLKHGPYLHYFGDLKILGKTKPDPTLRKELISRQTSRESYFSTPLTNKLALRIKEIAKKSGIVLDHTNDSEKVRRTMLLNQDAIFKDVRNKTMHDELAKWLRYTDKQAQKTGDGLSARCLKIPGYILFIAMKIPYLTNNFLTSRLLKNYYLKTMQHVPSIVWMYGNFDNHKQHLESGRAFMKIWMEISKEGYYLHPYGSVPTSEKMLNRFHNIVGHSKAEKVWMILRVGKSTRPPKSYRISLEDHFINNEGKGNVSN